MTCARLIRSFLPSDVALPDVVTSNTPPPTPQHDVYFFSTEELCPAHANIHAPTRDTDTPATTTAPTSPPNLRQLCWVAPATRKEQDRGATGGAEGTCEEWTRVGKELKQVGDAFHLEHRAVSHIPPSPVSCA